MKKTLPIFAGFLFLLAACSKHENQLRAAGLREISGKVFIATEGQPNLPLAKTAVMVADWDECVQNFKKLKDKHAAAKGQSPLGLSDYWQVLGGVVQGVETDASGEFKMTVSAKKSLVLCASAAHGSGSGITRNYWLIRLNEAPVQRFELSNRNSMPDVQTIDDMVIVH